MGASWEDADGVVITQVVPPYYLTDLKIVALYRRSLQEYIPTRGGVERAGKDPTREGLIHAMESIHAMDLGLGSQLILDYSARDH